MFGERDAVVNGIRIARPEQIKEDGKRREESKYTSGQEAFAAAGHEYLIPR